MSSNRRASKARKSTTNYYRLPFDKHRLFDPDAFLSKDRCANQSQSTQSGSRHTDKLFTTPQLVSALTGIWNLVGHPESSGTTDQRSVSEDILHTEDPVCFTRDREGHTLTSCSESSTGLNSQTCLSTPKSIHEDLRLLKKMLMLRSRSNMIGASATWRHMHLTSKLGNMHYQNIYPMQTKKLGACATSSSMEIKEGDCFGRGDNCCNQTGDMPAEQCTSSSEEDNITYACENSLHDEKLNTEVSREYSNMSACSSEQVCKEARIMLENQISSTCEHIRPEGLTCTSCVVGDAIVNPPNVHQYTYGEDVSQQHFVDKRSSEFESSLGHRFHGPVGANKHAAAGALAGTVVSISLHPVDTVKTIIQANSSGQSSFYHILRRTLVERGVLGLYGGLASKIACSAPISAIYTLTYEIVKGSLLPTLPKDYHSIAHCAAGGCSSIATSFIFTPSECIKQQMQVGSQYQNCWKALVGCLQRGGIASLYAGWGAVLCRNIPHSIVKFYAYESLKQFLLNASPANAKLNSGQTLICGGFAGSTAALFTNPFDVVKTRVQLQALSPVRKYEGVLHALAHIFEQEGLRGLYRGLSPRLLMYVSQGALFFTSYEFLKTIMFPEQELQANNI
ncbi:hypothetical protein CFC21_083879 [Triticum aestivum]|uniref:Mitochondrial carrier protein n=3 Tax=Triticum TaxID=4564 RepID=A0A9R0Y3E1_TRITD|nr:mitochondrial aspartate-glutamate transporter AGC1-like isoform X1 [Triticum dicoccoides]XP_044403713.1 mitochondrial aspartate-glutamate transporter AGC1-like isoform X1 [Triticum aestivum]KAF7079678.1 hypothetical protein CFC21_083879 [Triticum aestivum]VAI47731.1 unnamed protein product [Triticum turgidum subsp. durum]